MPSVVMDPTADRWLQVTSWSAIALVVMLALLRSLLANGQDSVAPPLHSSIAQIRLWVGLHRLAGENAGADINLPDGGDHRIQAAVAVGRGEIHGSAQTLESLAKISDNNAEVHADLELLKSCYAGDPVDQVRLQRTWGWIGELASVHDLPPDDARHIAVLRPAMRAAQACVLGLLLVMAALIVGIVMASLALVRWRAGRLVMAPLPAQGNSACLLTFAAYLMAFTGFGALIHTIIDTPSLNVMWLFLPIAVGVLWIPMLQYHWSRADLRLALGLHRGKGVLTEIGAGIAGYVTGLPLVAVGVITTMVLSQWFHTDHPVTHEIFAEGATLGGAISILALAAGFAPLVEETMFRGVLLHHLRRHGQMAAVLVSALIFAAIHPQGIAGIPALTAIGVVFAMIRIWRGSLIASMTAHALHNGTMVIVLVLVMG